MEITIKVTQEQLALIRQGLMCGAAISTDRQHKEQAKLFHKTIEILPDPWFPKKPQLKPLKDVSDLAIPVTTVSPPGDEPKTYLCRACGVGYSSWDDALDCSHPENLRAQKEIKYLQSTKPENWEYSVFALQTHYIND